MRSWTNTWTAESPRATPESPTDVKDLPRTFLVFSPISTASMQGLTLVHFSAQLEPCLTQENTLHTPNTP